MKRHILLILFLVCLAGSAAAQNVARAEALFTAGSYQEALRQYRALHTADPHTVLYTYRLARCEQETGDYDAAVQHFIEAGERYSMRNYYLGLCCFYSYRFEEAEEALSNWFEINDSTEQHYAEARKMFDKAGRALRYLKRIEDVAITDSAFIAQKGAVNANNLIVGALSGTSFGKIEQAGGLYSFTNQRGDRRYTTVRLSDGRTVICKQEKLLDSWGETDTLPDNVNFSRKQNYPFLMDDGLTLYYAAEDANGLGGWDIYVTRFNPSNQAYTTPEMIGMPFNSLDNDYLYLLDEANGKGWFVSDRSGRLMLYTFIPNADKILLQADDDYIRHYAQLQVLRKQAAAAPADEEEEDEPATTAAELLPEAPKYDFTLAVNDSTVYHYLTDFRSDDARQKAAEYIDLLSQIEEEQQDLSAKRYDYLNAETPEEKQALAPVILAEEKDIIRMKKDAAALLREVRQLEK